MTEKVQLSCESEVVMIPLGQILPVRKLSPGIEKSAKYKCIEASIKELGLIEPLVVFPQKNSDGAYIILDGHVRFAILKQQLQLEAKCLIANDDEGFTYNHKISRMTAIQEHFMIMRAIKNGVSESRIARSLDVDIGIIRQKRDLLEGICREAVQLLKDHGTTANAFRELRKVKPMRQIEIAELMCAADNFSVGYAQCLVAATQTELLVESDHPKEMKGLSPEDISRMEHEMESLGKEFRLIEESHGTNVLNLVLVVGYLRKLLDNARVVRFLSPNYPEILVEFQKLVEAKHLQGSSDS